jgi:F0F1-type ATP synthase delta subunit
MVLMKQKINLAITMVVLGWAPLPVLAGTTSNTIDTDKNEWVSNHSENGREFNLRIKGKPQFTDDYSDLKSLSAGGSLTIEEKAPSVSRKLEITAGADGKLQRSYWVNGAPRELDAEARQWLSSIILDAVRQSGYDAERRVAQLFERGGAAAVFDELAQIKGDYAKSIYLRQLLKDRQVDAATARKVVQIAARDISSAYEKRQVLAAVAGKYLDDKDTLAEFAAAIPTINSDYDRGQSLAALVKDRKLSSDQLKIVLPAVAKMSSDYEKANGLLGLLQAGGVEAVAQPAFFEAVNGIQSAYDRARVLNAVLAAKPDNQAVKLIVTSAGGIPSDYEKAQVLIAAAKITEDQQIRKMLIETARGIRSDYERGNVLSAATK